MSKKIDEKTGVTRYFVLIDGKDYETNEAIHEIYYKMDRRERYLQERSAENELSYEALEDATYPLEMRMLERQKTVEEIVIGEFVIEKVMEALSCLSEKEKWVLQQIYFQGKSVVDLAEESGQSRTTIQSRKTRALAKMKEILAEKYKIE